MTNGRGCGNSANRALPRVSRTRPLGLGFTQRLLLARVALHQRLSLRLVLSLEFLPAGISRGRLGSARVIGSLLLLECLPLLLLGIAQFVLLLLIRLVARGIAGARDGLVHDRG